MMHLELDQRWQDCKGQADEHYSEPRSLAADSGNADNLYKALETYHAIYNDIREIIAQGQGAESGISSGNDEEESQTHL